MTGLLCSYCGASIFESVWGCKDPTRPCGQERYDYAAKAASLTKMKNSQAFEAYVNADWDRVFGEKK